MPDLTKDEEIAEWLLSSSRGKRILKTCIKKLRGRDRAAVICLREPDGITVIADKKKVSLLESFMPYTFPENEIKVEELLSECVPMYARETLEYGTKVYMPTLNLGWDDILERDYERSLVGMDSPMFTVLY